MFRMLLLMVMFSAMLNKLAIAELNVSVSKSQVMTGIKNPRYTNNFILFENTDSPLAVSPAALITLQTDAKFSRVKARTSLFESVEVAKLSETEYLLVGPGKFAVEVTTFDPEKGIDEKILTVELGDSPVPPSPPPGPMPEPSVIPDDQFNNLGKRVREWSKDLPKRKELGGIYKDAAKSLTENPIMTINDATTLIVDNRTKLLGTDLNRYSIVFENLNADLRSRWPLTRGDMVLYMQAVSAGLEN
jgi:hypothetical protein